MHPVDVLTHRPAQDVNGRASILVVDDDVPILEAVADILEIHGYQVVTARDGLSGLERLRTFQPDLIISDIMMPDMDGYQFFEMVRRNPAWIMIPFMFLTAKGQKTDIRHGYQLGADDFITKPFETEDLLMKIELRIRRARDISLAASDSIERMKEQLLTIFGHELRTPLTYIYGYANMLQETRAELDEDSINQMLSGIHLGAERLVRLTESLLMIVRIDSGTIEAEIKHRSRPIDLRDSVQASLDRLSQTLLNGAARLEIDLPAPLMVNGVEYLLVDVMTRVMDNALRHGSPGNTPVQVSGGCRDGFAVVEVTDHGPGIGEDDRDRIFERFVQINRDLMEQQGVGLGLAISRSLVSLHGGVLEIDSRPEEGSTFRVSIPLAGDA